VLSKDPQHAVSRGEDLTSSRCSRSKNQPMLPPIDESYANSFTDDATTTVGDMSGYDEDEKVSHTEEDKSPWDNDDVAVAVIAASTATI